MLKQNMSMKPTKSKATVATDTAAINAGGTNKKKAPVPPAKSDPEKARRKRVMATFKEQAGGRYGNPADGSAALACSPWIWPCSFAHSASAFLVEGDAGALRF